MTRDDIIQLALEHFGAVLKPSDFEVKLAVLAVTAEREACAKVCEEKQTYSMSIPCPDGISGCCVNHFVPARREKTGTECAAAIRARNEQEKPR